LLSIGAIVCQRCVGCHDSMLRRKKERLSQSRKSLTE
jgi:hypothetical protein